MPDTSKLADGIVRAFREVDPKAREAGKRWGNEIEQGIGTPKVELKADTARAKAEMDEAARDRRSTVHMGVDSSQLGTVERGVSSAITQGGQSGIAGMQPALMGVGVTMLAGIASAFSGLAGLIPAGLLGAGGLVGTLAIGLDGVKDAYDAVNKAAQSSGQEQIDKSREVASAQRSLTDAVQSQSQAQKDVAQAYRESRNQLDDLNLSLQGGKISEAQAFNNVLKARRDLAKGGFKDQLEYNDAVLRVQESEQSWEESKQRNVELQQKSNDANAKGVENSDQVVAAKEKERRANEQVTAAQTTLTAAQDKTSESAKTAMQAMAQLSPQGQALVNTLMSMKPALMDFKNHVQDALLMNLGPQIQQLSSTYLPMLQGFMTSMATTMNQTFTQISKFLMQPQNLALMQTVFDNLGKSFSVFMQAMQPATEAFLKFSQVGSGFLPQLAQMMVQGANAVNKFAQSGQLQQWMQTGMDALGELAKMLPTVMQMFGDLAPIGMATLQGLNQILTALQPAIAPLATLLTALITNGVTPMLTLVAQLATTIVQALAPALTAWLNAMGPLAQQLVSALTPVLQQLGPAISQVAMALINQLVPIIQQMIPYIGPLVKAFGDLVIAVLPLIPQFYNLAMQLSPLFQAVLPGLAQAFITLAPYLIDFLTRMANFATNVMPTVMDVATKVGEAFKTAFDMVKKAVTTVWDVIRPIFELLKNAIGDVATPLGKLFDMVSKIPGLRSLAGLTDSGRGGGFIPKTPGGAVPGPRGTLIHKTAGAMDKQSVANLIVGEAMKRGYSASEAQAILAYSIGESSLNPGVSGGVQGDDEVVGLFQEKGAFARSGGIDPAQRSDPLANITAYLNQLEAHRNLPIEQALPKTSVGGPLASGPGSAPQPWGPLMAQAAALMPATATPVPATPPIPAPARTTAIPGSIPTMTTLPDAHGAHSQIAQIAAIAEQFGLKLTAGRDDHSADGGFHPLGEAGDFSNGSGNTPQEAAFAEYMKKNFGPMLAELIYSDPNTPGVLTKNGRDAPGTSVYDAGTLGMHQNHVHVAVTDEMAAAFQQAIGGAAPGAAMTPPTLGGSPVGNEQDPLYVQLPASAQQGNSGAGQLGQDFLGGILQEFGMDGSVFKDPTSFGLFKIFKGLMGLKVSGGDGASMAAPGGGGGGASGLLGGLLNGIVPQAFGPLKSGSPTDAPGEFMPLMPGSGGGAVNFPSIAASGQTGAPGPGNVVDNSITVNGVPNPAAAFDAANQANVPRMRTGLRNVTS